MKYDCLEPTGEITIIARNELGEILWRKVIKNLIVDTFRTLVRRRLGTGAALPNIIYLQFGTDSSNLSVANTELGHKVDIDRGLSVTYPDVDDRKIRVQFSYTWPLVDALNGTTVGEMGLFSDTVGADDDFEAGQRMYSRAVCVPGIQKTGALTFEIVWTLTL